MNRYLIAVLLVVSAILWYLIFVAIGWAKPTNSPPSVIPGPTICKQTNCKRRRVWRKRFRALPASDRAWLRSTRTCESHGRYRTNTGNGYFGAYQFSWKTALAAGFTMIPSRTWRYEQDVRAARWMHVAGKGQWPICG